MKTLRSKQQQKTETLPLQLVYVLGIHTDILSEYVVLLNPFQVSLLPFTKLILVSSEM